MFSCRDVAAHTSDHLEGALPWQARVRLLGHLAVCGHCRRLLRQLRAVTGALGRLADDPLPATRPRRARAPRVALAGAALAAVVAGVLMLLPLPGLHGELYAHAVDAHAQPGAPVPAAAVAQVLAGVGTRLDRPLPGVVYANRCPFRQGFAAHFLLVRGGGQVTVMVLPFAAPEDTFARGHLHGVLVRSGAATVAVLAADAQRARALAGEVAGDLRHAAGDPRQVARGRRRRAGAHG